MVDKVVLVCSATEGAALSASVALSGSGARLLLARSTARALELVLSGAVDLLLVDWPSALEVSAIVKAARGRTPVIALAREDGRGALDALFSELGVMHVCVARAGEDGIVALDVAELAVTARKILSHDRFGVGRYLAGEGVALSHHVVVRADDRDRAVEVVAELVRSLGGGRRMTEAVALVADELITNAVYNAPRTADGAPRYAHVNRREKITLDPAEYVRIEYGTDGRHFALAVVDNFGALHPDTLRGGVRRCLNEADQIEQKAGGAGLGIYTALSSCTQLVVNLEAGVRTEIIALWDLARRGRGARAGSGSLHVFAEVTGTPPDRMAVDTDVDQAVPEPSVALSDSVKLDINEVLARAGARLALARTASGTIHNRLEAQGTSRAVSAVPEADLSPSISGPIETWRERADLTGLRGVQLLRRADRPGLHTTLARIRGASTLADAVAAAMTYLVNEWTAAVLLCQIGDSLVPWTAAGDLDQWDALGEVSIPLAPEALARGSIGHAVRESDLLGPRTGWFGVRAALPGVSLAPVTRDLSARRLSDLLMGTGSNEAVAMSFGDEGEVLLVLFATRPRSSRTEDSAAYEQLHDELTALMQRIAQPARLAIRRLETDEEHEITIELELEDMAPLDDLWRLSPMPVS